jgi:hypothetical protein
LEECIDGGLPVPQDSTQLSPPLIPGAENLSKGNRHASQLGTDSPAQESVLMEDSDLGHIAGIKP